MAGRREKALKKLNPKHVSLCNHLSYSERSSDQRLDILRRKTMLERSNTTLRTKRKRKENWLLFRLTIPMDPGVRQLTTIPVPWDFLIHMKNWNGMGGHLYRICVFVSLRCYSFDIGAFLLGSGNRCEGWMRARW